MDWFERLTGFRETGYDDTRRRLEVRDGRLHSRVNGRSYRVGALELASLADLRARVAAAGGLPGRLKVAIVRGDVRRMHQHSEYAGALFQVASQFNLLEMTSPQRTPEDGVTGYEHDHTQGPACAIAAGAATIYRNHFVPLGDGCGQTAARQLDGLADLAAELAGALGMPVEALWSMENGYALCLRAGLDAIARYLPMQRPQRLDFLRGKLRVGVHSDVEVTDAEGAARPSVSQVFCSALPVAYSRIGAADPRWPAFASLVLEAAYEATLWAAVLNAHRGASRIVLLTRLGGGVFGNRPDWIHDALRRALMLAQGFGIDVRLVCFNAPPDDLRRLVDDFR